MIRRLERWLAFAWRGLTSVAGWVLEALGIGPDVDPHTRVTFRAIADVFIELEMVEVGNDVRRQVNVKRFAGMGEQVGDTIGYSVRSGTGIVIESRSVA